MTRRYSYPTGNKHWLWKSGRRVTREGYVWIVKHGHPHADKDGYVLEHRWVMEQIIGRYPEKHEDVHHINGNKQDNRPENLQLITDSEHGRLHGYRDMSNRRCIDCNSNYTRNRKWYEVSNNVFRCTKCFFKQYYILNKERWKTYKHD